MGWLDFLKPKQIKESTAPSKEAGRREALSKLKVKESLDSWEMFDFLRDRYYGNGQWYFPLSGMPAVGGTTNKIQGRNQYVFYTEQDLRFQRDAARILYASEPVAKAIEGNLNAFVIGKGMKYKLCLKKGYEEKAAEDQLQEYQQLLDQWMDEEQWPEREQECFTAKVVDGEFFLRVVKTKGRVRTIRIEPEHIQNPEGATFEDGWWLGVKYNPKDYETPLAYGYKLYGQAWEEIPAEEIIHFKSNVSRNVSRGVSDFYPILDDLDSIAKLSDNMRAGATAQAEIAYMMSVKNATPDSINAFADEQAEVTLTNSVTGLEDKSRRSRPGSVKYHGNNVEYTTMPQGASQGYIEVYANSMRIVASAFCMPEYMLTSDASNANYSSTLVAGTPFYRYVEKLQNLLKRPFKQVMMRVLDDLYASTLIPTELRAYLDIDVTCDSPVVVDPLQDAQRRDIELRNGVISPQMWAMEQGRDPEKVQQQIDEWRDANMEAVQAQQGIFPPDQQQGQDKPAVKEAWDEGKHPREDDGKFARFQKGKALSKEDRAKTLKSVVDVYKASNLQKSEIKGYDSGGDPIYGYPHSPELFVKSDVTGSMVRHYITLPDGTKAHPSELYPEITQAEIDKSINEAKYEERKREAEESARMDRVSTVRGEANEKYKATGRPMLHSYFSTHDDGRMVRVDGTDIEEQAFYLSKGFIKSSQAIVPTRSVSGDDIGQTEQIRKTRMRIKELIKDGKHVPDEVMAFYPDLHKSS